MTRDNVDDLIDQCAADGHIFLIAIAEDAGEKGSVFTVWDNIRDAEVENGEREFMEDIETSFKRQDRW